MTIDTKGPRNGGCPAACGRCDYCAGLYDGQDMDRELIARLRAELVTATTERDDLAASLKCQERQTKAAWGAYALAIGGKPDKDAIVEAAMPDGPALRVFAGLMAEVFEQNGGKNFLTFAIGWPPEAEKRCHKMEITIRNCDGVLTPSERIAELETEIDRLRAELATYSADVASRCADDDKAWTEMEAECERLRTDLATARAATYTEAADAIQRLIEDSRFTRQAVILLRARAAGGAP